MERNWTDVGRQLADYHGEHVTQAQLAATMDSLVWAPPEARVAFSDGFALNRLIQELHIPKVLRVAKAVVEHTEWPSVASPYQMLGVESMYANGLVRVYAVDTGTDLIVVASDFEAKVIAGRGRAGL
jgi:hypothetical protein